MSIESHIDKKTLKAVKAFCDPKEPKRKYYRVHDEGDHTNIIGTDGIYALLHSIPRPDGEEYLRHDDGERYVNVVRNAIDTAKKNCRYVVVDIDKFLSVYPKKSETKEHRITPFIPFCENGRDVCFQTERLWKFFSTLKPIFGSKVKFGVEVTDNKKGTWSSIFCEGENTSAILLGLMTGDTDLYDKNWELVKDCFDIQ